MENFVTVSNANSKLGAQIYSINLPVGITCRPDAPCFKDCYARRGHEKCGKSEKSSVYFSNHIPDANAAFEYEFGTKKDQKGKYWWICDCGGSMYVTRKFIKKEELKNENN